MDRWSFDVRESGSQDVAHKNTDVEPLVFAVDAGDDVALDVEHEPALDTVSLDVNVDAPDASSDASVASDVWLPDTDALDASGDTSLRDGGYPSDSRADADVAEGEGGPQPCVPVHCGTHSWACWPMPNTPGSGLPHPASYTDMGDHTIRDNVTCLIWESNPATNVAYTWSDAQLRCTQNPLHAGVGWRVPTRIELMSLVDYSKKNPAIDKTVFPQNLSQPPYWTSSAMPAIANFGYLVKFYDGVVNFADQSSMYFAQCVTGNGEDPNLPISAPGDHYEIRITDVVDHYTGLVWQRDDSEQLSTSSISWQDATIYCQTLGLNSATWRLPSVKELATLVDEDRLGQLLPLVDLSAFPNTTASDYWSSTDSDTQPWTVSFQDASAAHTITTAFARCVH